MSHLSEIHRTTGRRNFILLNNIAKRRLPTPLRISGKEKNGWRQRKSCKGHQGPSEPQPAKNSLFLKSSPREKVNSSGETKMIIYPPQRRVISETNYFSVAGALRGPEVPYNFLLCRQPFFPFL